MANLLYVTQEGLEKLSLHPAYQFWAPLVHVYPLRNSPIEERAFHPQDVEVENDLIYLTIDMKFVYCRDGMLSFLYAEQDLSFRFTVAQGILRTLDGKQFSAVLGLVAEVKSSSDITLLNTDRVYHPFFDSGIITLPEPGSYKPAAAPGAVISSKGPKTKPASRKRKPKKQKMMDEDELAEIDVIEQAIEDVIEESKPQRRRKAAAKPAESAEKPAESAEKPAESAQKPAESAEKPAVKPKETEKPARPAAKEKADRSKVKALVLGKYDPKLCHEIIEFRQSSKKSYGYLAEKYGVLESDLKKIFTMRRPDGSLPVEAPAGKGKAKGKGPAADPLGKYPKDVREQIVRMKKVSKKSYQYLSDKFGIPIDDVHKICSEKLKRPRRQVKK